VKWLLRDGIPQNTVMTIASHVTMKQISASRANEPAAKKEASPPRSAPGFLLLDSLLNPVSFNGEAVQILSYPDTITTPGPPDGLLAERIRSVLMTAGSSDEPSFVREFQSGRRRYFCRVFHMDSNAKEPSQPRIAVLLERGPSALILLSKASEQFSLTRREREVLEYLLQGMSSREIANRMNVSPSTVKAFLRLIMIKTKVSSRSAILGKIIMS
jgi:DNA-binding CsgD family transcriptional regulator